MRIGLYVHSVTGNTRLVSRWLADMLRARGHEVELMEMDPKTPLPRDRSPLAFDRVGFAFPTMAFRPSTASRRFLAALASSPEPRPAFVLVTSAGMGATSDLVYARTLATKNLAVYASAEVLCEDSFIPFRKWFGPFFKRGRPNEETRQSLSGFVEEVLSPEPVAKPIRPSVVQKMFGRLGDRAPEDGPARMLGPRALDEAECTRCGLCADICPTGAIIMGEGRPAVTEGACVGCCGCFNRCPSGAWRLRRFSKRYYYPGPGRG